MTPKRGQERKGGDAFERVRAVKNAHQDALLDKANVVGVGVGMRRKGNAPESRLVLVVMVSRKLPVSLLRPEDVVPREIEGIPTVVEEVGDVKAFV